MVLAILHNIFHCFRQNPHENSKIYLNICLFIFFLHFTYILYCSIIYKISLQDVMNSSLSKLNNLCTSQKQSSNCNPCNYYFSVHFSSHFQGESRSQVQCMLKHWNRFNIQCGYNKQLKLHHI